MFRSGVAAVLAALVVSGCAEDRLAPYDEIAARAYVSDEPPSLTLYSVLRTKDGAGAHTALMVNASQQVLFDPAGSFEFPTVPERGDVLYGFTPRMRSVYIDFHARETFDVVEQTVYVSPEVANLALQKVQQNGAVAPAGCTGSVARILRELPGFETLRQTPFPANLAKQFAELPGVEVRTISDDDADDNHGVLLQARDLMAGQAPATAADN